MDYTNPPTHRCPECDNEGQFDITATSDFEFTQEGAGDHRDVLFDQHSPISCSECGYHALAGEFSRALQRSRGEAVDEHAREAVLTIKLTYDESEVDGDSREVIRRVLHDLVARELANGGFTADTTLMLDEHAVEVLV